MQQLNSLFIPIQRLVIQQKTLINWLFLVFEAGLLVCEVIAAWAFLTQNDLYMWWWMLGGKFGILSVCLYILTLLPGIMTRLKLLPAVSSSLMLFRRHLGISMFLSAFVHSSLTTSLPILGLGLPLRFTDHQLLGMGSIAVLFPLWLTSNDLSKKYLGTKWKLLHKLTYLALALIFAHVALVSLKIAVVLAAVGAAEMLSWLVYWQNRRGGARTNPIVSSAETEKLIR